VTKLIILDRDGVINYDSDDYIKSLEEFKFIPRSIQAICLLSKSGYQIGIATNQSGIFRKYYSLKTLNQMHQSLISTVKENGGSIHKIVYCPHGPDEKCDCRKPNTGMLKQLNQDLNCSKHHIQMVGDSITDLQAAQLFGIKSILVRTGKGLRSIEKLNRNPELLDNPIQIFDDLYAFAVNLTSQSH